MTQNLNTSKAQDVRSTEDERKKIPRWLPITLLTVSTIALAIPTAMLWKQKKALVQPARFSSGKNQAASVPPARRRPLAVPGAVQSRIAKPSASSRTEPFTSAPPPRRTSLRSDVLTTRSPTNAKPLLSPSEQSRGTGDSVSLFDGPLMSLGALGIATAAVGVGALLGIWGVQRTLGVNGTEEFATRVRQLLLTHMPVISQRIYRSSSEDDDAIPSHRNEEKGDWTWDAAEGRLRDAFDRGGVREWAECAISEMEAEEKIERRRRGL